MTAYTADDFAKAEFARNRDGRIAARLNGGTHGYEWTTEGFMGAQVSRGDADMAAELWAPVQEQAGSYTRADEPVDPDGDAAWWRARAEETEVQRDEWKARTEKAEQERDEARKFATAEHVRATGAERERDEARADLAEYVQAQALRTQPRPLTADDIKPLVREREQQITRKIREAHDRDPRPSSLRIAAAVYQGLTEPTRPEGAEDVAVRLFQAGAAAGVEMTEEQRDALADHLAAMHVRVVGEEQS